MVACEQTLRGALAAGRGKEGELATTSLEFEFYVQFACGSPSSSPSFSRPAANAPRRACSQVTYMADERAAMKAEKVTLLGGFCYLNGHCINVNFNEFLKR